MDDIEKADPDSDPGGQKWCTEKEIYKEIFCFEVQDILFQGLEVSPIPRISLMET